MIGYIFKKMFGTANERYIQNILNKEVIQVNKYKKDFTSLTDEEIKAKTQEFKEQVKNGTDLESLLAPAFALVCIASERTLELSPYDVQILGAVVLHKGQIAEMKTGEGKTLVAALAAYLNSLKSSVHIVTVNDYLAKRDAEWMGRIYKFLGLTVGVITSDISEEERQKSYSCDIVYATNNELGFDYLRDNMKWRPEEQVQKQHSFAIVDEVDSILIDEARTPLIISGPSNNSSQLYTKINTLISAFNRDTDCDIDEKHRSLSLTEAGMEKAENILIKNALIKENESMYSIENIHYVHHINQALKAHFLFQKDKDYMIAENEVLIIDEFTGRALTGRRYSDGLHQALEAKEKVEIKEENQTLATITFQNYFRMYSKLSGMTGTAMTEATEFEEIYKLHSVEIPTNQPVTRKDLDDQIYRTLEEKNNAIIKEIRTANKKGQPVLVGTASIESSEIISKLLKSAKIKHSVLNAKYHQQEALIIANAGRVGAVTIATNMAGRGTDIKLGGNSDIMLKDVVANQKQSLLDSEIRNLKQQLETTIKEEKQKVLDAGGLYIVGTERHESRRIDNQLRGRSGRQGDPGISRFFLSLEDDLMRIFGSQRLDTMLKKLGIEEGEAIEHPWVSKALEKAQKKVESYHFEVRKQLLKFDDVMNEQRKTIFTQRKDVMINENINDIISSLKEEIINELINLTIPKNSNPNDWDIIFLNEEVKRIFNLNLNLESKVNDEGVGSLEIKTFITKHVDKAYSDKRKQFGDQLISSIEKAIMLQSVDNSWKEHLSQLEHLKQGIGLRAYGQKDPLNEYKREAFNLFSALLEEIKIKTIELLWHVKIENPETEQQKVEQLYNVDEAQWLEQSNEQPNELNSSNPPPAKKPIVSKKIPRNNPCPCGSGKKYKHCHGKVS